LKKKHNKGNSEQNKCFKNILAQLKASTAHSRDIETLFDDLFCKIRALVVK
jgi:hypothetical protein